MNETSQNNVNIKLGDIIEIEALNDKIFHNIKFYVKYIDTNKLVLLSEDNEEQTLFINEEGNLSNESISSINILYREPVKGYARQNGLITGVWIDLHFNTNIPIIITGKITNLDEDQIEIKTITGDILYIDFGYKGIPNDIPIEKILIRDTPITSKNITSEEDEEVNKEMEEIKDEEDKVSKNESMPIDDIYGDELIKDEDIESKINNIEDINKNIFEADQISFGEDLEEIVQVINIPESKKLYSIDKQTNDMLNDFLSNIANINRTEEVVNNIHLIISRYVQLRKEFSTFDENNNIITFIKKGAEYKPLVKSLQELNKKLYWIIPVTKNKKKIYDIDNEDDNSFIIQKMLGNSLQDIDEINNKFMETKSQDSPNKYKIYLDSITDYYKSFSNSNMKDDVIISKEIGSDINAIINNFEDFNSNVVEKNIITKNKFVSQNYNTGLHYLKNIKNEVILNKIKNDVIDIKSFITLPLNVLKFSYVNLPTTNIMMKADLNNNFMSLWKILNKNSNINTHIVTDINKPLDHEKDIYLNNITEYTIDPDIISKYSNQNELYENFLNTIIPKTRVLFNLIKKNITEKLTVYDIIRYLEPFMIYSSDISYMQYNEFIIFIREKIKEYKKRYVENIRNLSDMYVGSRDYELNLHTILKNNEKIFSDVIESYKLPKDNSMSNEEIMAQMFKIDNCHLYNSAIKILTIKLKLTNNIQEINTIINEKKLLLENQNKNNSEIKDDCKKYVITKNYNSVDELEEDNGKDIYYDKKYDKTLYELINEYESEIKSFEDEEIKIGFLSKKLQEKNGLTENNSLREAKAIIQKKRMVEEGEYAVLNYNDNMLYYKREDKTWIQDKSIDEKILTDDTKLFCNFNLNCIDSDNECENIKNKDNTIKINKYKDIVDEFDTTLNLSKEKIISDTKKTYEKALEIIKKNKIITNKEELKYNKQKKIISGEMEINDIIISPYDKLASIILGQNDIVKKYNDISKFIQLYTREPENRNEEDEMWLYCITTGVKLLPVFIKKLSDAFLTGNTKFYLDTIAILCSTQGTISDDEAFWIDEYSGYNIVPIEFSNQEDYNEQGFKIKTNDFLENDIIIDTNDNKSNKYNDNPIVITSNAVINAFIKFTGVIISNDNMDFIINNVILNSQNPKILPSKKSYEAKINKQDKKDGKKFASYEKFKKKQIIILTLCYLLIVIQTSIPDIKTKKQFPGCKTSFKGYPLDNNEDNISGIKFIACVISNIKSSIEPWDAIKSMNEKKIIIEMLNIIKKYILSNSDVKNVISKKLENKNIIDDEDDVIENLNLITWNNFLPLMSEVKLDNVNNITNDFISELKDDMKKGSMKQYEKIEIIRGKIILYTAKIQEVIQNIISQKTTILSSNSQQPFLENACCNENNFNSLEYFINIKPEIINYNNNNASMQDLLDDIGKLGKAPIVFSPENTKSKKTTLKQEYSEETIYQAFITYCNFNSELPISSILSSVCLQKPEDYDINNSIKENINILKENGVNYTSENLIQLMNIINKNNIIKLEIHNATINNIQSYQNILQNLNSEDSSILPNEFIEKMLSMINNFDNSKNITEDTVEMIEIKNYLKKEQNVILRNEIIQFLKENTNIKKDNKIFDCIKNIMKFNINVPDDNLENNIRNKDNNTFTSVDFIKNIFRDICITFPNMILNKIDYTEISIPKHWKLSFNHNIDIKNYLQDYYKTLYQFYDDDVIEILLNKVIPEINIIYELAMNTYYNGSIYDNETRFYSIFSNDICEQLFTFYFYSIIIKFINILQEDEEDFFNKSEYSSDDDKDDDLSYIISGETSSLNKKVANFLKVIIERNCLDKENINFSYDMLMNKIHREKEREKDNIVETLKNMSTEEREIENMFKNNKLGKWSKGLQKGLFTYQAGTYDEERAEIEKQMIIDAKLGSGVNDPNRDILAMDMETQNIIAEQIENEEYSLNHLGNDDDYGNFDGDEFY